MNSFTCLSLTEDLFPEMKEEEKESSLDAAEYLFKESKYHDVYFTVGNSTTDQVERIGAVSSHLLAHSSVFRTLLKDFGIDTSNIPVKNVSPKVFKLMLRHIYGGNLPEMDRLTIAQLALCAGMYSITPLVTLSCQRLVPTEVEEVFPALWCVAYMKCPELEPPVTKIIQEETGAVTNSKEFLELDAKCVDFIARQEKLAITELALWNALIRWAQFKADADPSKTVRQHLETTLQYVRLTTLSQDEVIKEVMPHKVLSSNEMLELLTAVANNRPWEFPGLCKIQRKRELSEILTQNTDITAEAESDSARQTLCTFESQTNAGGNDTLDEVEDYQSFSIFTINALKDIEIDAFTFRSRSIAKQGNLPIYKLSCTITICKTENGFYKDTCIIQVGGSVVSEENITFPLRVRNGQLPKLKASSVYKVVLEFLTIHPVFKLKNNENTDTTYCDRHAEENMVIKFNTPPHVRKIQYKV